MNLKAMLERMIKMKRQELESYRMKHAYNFLRKHKIEFIVNDENIVCDECSFKSTDEKRFTYNKKTLCNYCN